VFASQEDPAPIHGGDLPPAYSHYVADISQPADIQRLDSLQQTERDLIHGDDGLETPRVNGELLKKEDLLTMPSPQRKREESIPTRRAPSDSIEAAPALERSMSNVVRQSGGDFAVPFNDDHYDGHRSEEVKMAYMNSGSSASSNSISKTLASQPRVARQRSLESAVDKLDDDEDDISGEDNAVSAFC
jgi:hypothetical protein